MVCANAAVGTAIRQRPTVCQGGSPVSLTLEGASAALTSVLRFTSEPELATRRQKSPLAHLVIQLTRPEQAAVEVGRHPDCSNVKLTVHIFPVSHHI